MYVLTQCSHKHRLSMSDWYLELQFWQNINCKWRFRFANEYIYIYIYYKIYAMNKSYEAFFARQLLCMQVILCVMKVTSWKVKVANMFVMLIIWCKIQEEGLQNLSTNFSDSRLWVFSWILRNICSKSKWTFS